METQSSDLPLWLYWEGPMPEWIRCCHDTIFRHGFNVNLLTPESFSQIRDVDLDIDINGLYVAHRADFIRAFLLARYGGLWVDSDCLVLKSLLPLANILARYEFVGYRERSGEVTNNLMGASPGSTLAKDYYSLVCDILRENRPIDWLTLGSKALTSVLDVARSSWCELHVEEVQPVCWSNPEAFFALRTDQEHSVHLNSRSYCYMLSANMVGGYMSEHKDADILDNRTFFSYLLRLSQSVEQYTYSPA